MKVLVVGTLHPEGLDLLKARAVVVETASPSPRDLADADVLVVRSGFAVDEALLERTPRLKAVGRPGSGLDRVDLDACRRRGIAVLSTPGAVAPAVAELALGLMLALARKTGTQLAGKSLGLLGFGHAGRALTPKAVAFGMKVLAHDPQVAESEIRGLAAEPVGFETLLARSDVLSLHVPLVATTRNLFGKGILARVKPGCLLVNCSRGGILDEMALAEALRKGPLSAAALDVFSQEPPGPSHPLLGLPNVLLTPHLGASTVEAQARSARALAAAILALEPVSGDGKPPARGL